MKFRVCITTYQRQQLLGDLLTQLAIEQHRVKEHTYKVVVYDDDPRSAPTRDVQAHIAAHDVGYKRFDEHRGKAGFWRTHGDILAHFQQSDAAVLVTLPDDCDVCEYFFGWLAAIFAQPYVDVINFHREAGVRDRAGSWGAHPPARVMMSEDTPLFVAPPLHVRPLHRVGLELVGWVDGFTAMRRKAAAAIGWRTTPIARPWHKEPHLGSGVGAQMTARLRAGGQWVYRPTRSLVRHRGQPSVMNPVARAHDPLATAYYMDDAS